MQRNRIKQIVALIFFVITFSLVYISVFANETSANSKEENGRYACKKTAHTHSESCLKDILICDLHIHEEACRDGDDLICGLEESKTLVCEETVHEHGESCYGIHSHDLSCINEPAFDCGIDEGEVLICEEKVHKHEESCYQIHIHEDSCKDGENIICGYEEGDILDVLVCEETVHEHGESCYGIHSHDLSCINEPAFDCGIDEGEVLICEEKVHKHEESCYQIHIHELDCYESVQDCGFTEEHEHTEECVPPTSNYYTNPINENIDVTLFDYGSYINAGDESTLLFGWHNNLYDKKSKGRPYEGIDGPAMNFDGKVFTNYSDLNNSLKIQNYPTMERTLNDRGYPQIAVDQVVKGNKGKVTGVSLEYLFPHSGEAFKTGMSTNPLSDYKYLREEADFIEGSGYNSNYESMRFDMKGDGGLFKKDEYGYYTYDSAVTSAYYDQVEQQFLLSETIMSPSHDGPEKFLKNPDYAKNFLPFNKINFDNYEQFYRFNDQWVYTTKYAEDGSVAEDIPNLWFGFTMELDFYIPEDKKVNGQEMIFDFTGDDDIWVYIDDVLVLDIGGCHQAVNSYINFTTGEVFDYNVGYSNGSSRKMYTNLKKVFVNALGEDYVNTNMAGMFDEDGSFVANSGHTIKFFYTERGGNISYCKLKFNMPQMPSGSLSVGKKLEAIDGSLNEFDTKAMSYDFRVMRADENGNASDELYIPAGAEFNIVDINDYEKVLETGSVRPDGYFSLKADQMALFEEVAGKYGNGEYVVEERIPKDLATSYGNVQYLASNKNVSNEVVTDDEETQKYLTYSTQPLLADKTQKVTYINKVKIDTLIPLSITKIEGDTGADIEQGRYKIKVMIGNGENKEPLSVGTKYTVGSIEKTVTEEGVIEIDIGETAVFRVLNGTTYKVIEYVESDFGHDSIYENEEGVVTEPVEVTIQTTYLRQIIVNKKIKASDINFANGNPIFIFEVRKIDDNERVFYKSIEFTKEYVEQNVEENGYVSLSVFFDSISQGVYVLNELEVMRYEIAEITDVVSGQIESEKSVQFDLKDNLSGEATYVNAKYENSNYSHSNIKINHIVD